jgi:hypothetical protein
VGGLLALRTQVEKSLKSMGVTGELKMVPLLKAEPPQKADRQTCQSHPRARKWKRCSIRLPPKK